MVPSIIPQNRLKQLLRQGKSAIGTMLVEVRQGSVMQVLSNAGLDFVIIDNEHGAFNIETISNLSRAARQVGVTPVVRVPEWSYAHVVQPLDAGAQAIMAPRITEPGQVKEILQMMKYPPVGRRGSVVARGHTGAGHRRMARAEPEDLDRTRAGARRDRQRHRQRTRTSKPRPHDPGWISHSVRAEATMDLHGGRAVLWSQGDAGDEHGDCAGARAGWVWLERGDAA